jgi:hypothetical protein
MQDPWQHLFDALCLDLERIERGTMPGATQIEACFRCCLEHWTQARELARQRGFADEPSEIQFFRQIKPSFTGLLEYYHHVYFHQLFCPPGDRSEFLAFEQNERAKMQQFREANAAFIAYYETGATDQDAAYFLRRHRPTDPAPYARVYDMDPEFLTAKDWVLTLYIGYARYEKFLGKMDKR